MTTNLKALMGLGEGNPSCQAAIYGMNHALYGSFTTLPLPTPYSTRAPTHTNTHSGSDPGCALARISPSNYIPPSFSRPVGDLFAVRFHSPHDYTTETPL